MKTIRLFVGLMAVQLVAVAVQALPLDLGRNITISDGNWSGTGWTGNREDQEVEPGCVTGQKWDLEGFFVLGNTLSMVGGYDFVNGADGHVSGDLFLDTDGSLSYGTENPAGAPQNGASTVANVWGYEYAVDMNFANKTYDVYQLTAASLVRRITESINGESNPWAYASGGTKVYSGTFVYTPGLLASAITYTDPNAQVGATLQGGVSGYQHNVAQIDLGDFLAPGAKFFSHFSMSCGNDNLMGHGRIPDAASTLALMGLALMGIERLRRRTVQ